MALPQNLMAGQGRVTVRFFSPPTRQAMRGDSDTSSETGEKKKTHTSAILRGIGTVARERRIDRACGAPQAKSVNQIEPPRVHECHQSEKRLIVPNLSPVLFSHRPPRESVWRSSQFLVSRNGRDAAPSRKTCRRRQRQKNPVPPRGETSSGSGAIWLFSSVRRAHSGAWGADATQRPAWVSLAASGLLSRDPLQASFGGVGDS